LLMQIRIRRSNTPTTPKFCPDLRIRCRYDVVGSGPW
jgi:hypothetical protein